MGLFVNAQVSHFSVEMYLCFRIKSKPGRQLLYEGIFNKGRSAGMKILPGVINEKKQYFQINTQSSPYQPAKRATTLSIAWKNAGQNK